MLVSRHPEVTLVDLGNLLQTGLEMLSGFILNTAVLDETGEVVLAILTCGPAKVVDVAVEREGTCGLQLVAETLLDLGLEVVQAHAVDGVLQTSVLTADKRG